MDSCVLLLEVRSDLSLLKDSGISLFTDNKKDLGSNAMDIGVSLQEATSKRDRIWMSPDLICIIPNLFPKNKN
jgi:hypothetical protein